MSIIVVGGGVAGMQAALTLNKLGQKVTILEKSDGLGGHVRGWHTLFPDFSPADETLKKFTDEVARQGIDVRYYTEVKDINKGGVTLASGEKLKAEAVVLCTGYKLFDARLKQEYGYSIYDKVITSSDLEAAFKEEKLDELCGKEPKTIAFVHCVGSRDQQVGEEHCSKVCCVTGVKQAIKIRKKFPNCEVYNFYMDIRMFGPGYEEMYRTAQQEHQIHFIRGRVSEVTPGPDGRVLLKTEDTLLARPMRISADLLVLLVGMCAEDSNGRFAKSSGIGLSQSGFVLPENPFEGNSRTNKDGIFVAGCASAPQNIGDSINSASNAALEVNKYLNR